MNYKTFLASLAMVATAIAPIAYAQSMDSATLPEPVATVVSDPTPLIAPQPTPEQSMRAELADLQAKESDPATGIFAKFFIRLRIRQLENQLNIQKALQ